MAKRWLLWLLSGALLCLALGCGTEPRDAPALRRAFPDQADAVLAASDGLGAEARLPDRGEGAVRFALAGGGEVQVRELGASEEGAPAEEAVAYARPGGVSFWSPGRAGAEEWLWLGADAVRRDAPAATWEVTGAALREQGDAVIVLGADGAAALRVTAPAAYALGGRPVAARLAAKGPFLSLWVDAEGEEVLVDPGWVPLKRRMSIPRSSHTATRLQDGRVLVVGGTVDALTGIPVAEIFDPVKKTWQALPPMNVARVRHTATLLSDGRVLVAGGTSDGKTRLDTVEIFDPRAPADEYPWTTGPRMSTPRASHTATALSHGRVLVTGGAATASAEIFDPSNPKQPWVSTGPMGTPRQAHMATLLSDGRVLVAGGGSSDGTVVFDSTEILDAKQHGWTPGPHMTTPRVFATATALSGGRALVVGGLAVLADDQALGTGEIFDPSLPGWTSTPPMEAARSGHTSVMLPGGSVLVAGGEDMGISLATAESFDPVSVRWTAVPSMKTVRADHSATSLTDGRVLVAGGIGDGVSTLATAEIFDPSSPGWSSVPSMASARQGHTASALPDGSVVVAGGSPDGLPDDPMGVTALAGAERFVPASSPPAWSALHRMAISRADHTASALPGGRVLVAGGSCDALADSCGSAEIFRSDTQSWARTGSMHVPRAHHAAVSLPDGRVLVTGGVDSNLSTLSSVEIFDPVAERWESTSSLHKRRANHTATLLLDGRVLVAGGSAGIVAFLGAPRKSAEILDLSTSTWKPVDPMITARSSHTATLLSDGRVLVAGGDDSLGAPLASAEVFDPSSETWTPADPMTVARAYHTATLLPDGRVLVAGGGEVATSIAMTPGVAGVEALDPSTLTWTPLPPMSTARAVHTATRLPDGRVLVAGGNDGTRYLASAEVWSLQRDGTGCSSHLECASGFCVDGVCCDRACNDGLCEACSEARNASADGVCTPLHPECAPFACSPATGECESRCQTVRDCAPGFACSAGGGCVPATTSPWLDDGGCALGDPGARGPAGAAVVILGVVCAMRRRRAPRAARR